MTTPICRDCGKECVWGKTKAGKPILMDLRPHFIACKKNGAKLGSKHSDSTTSSSAAEDAVAALRSLGYLKREAVELLRDIPEGEPADMVLAALKRKGGE